MKYEVGEWYETSEGEALCIFGPDNNGDFKFIIDGSQTTFWGGEEPIGGFTVIRHLPRDETEGWERVDACPEFGDALCVKDQWYIRRTKRVRVSDLPGTVEMRDGKPDFTTYKED